MEEIQIVRAKKETIEETYKSVLFELNWLLDESIKKFKEYKKVTALNIVANEEYTRALKDAISNIEKIMNRNIETINRIEYNCLKENNAIVEDGLDYTCYPLDIEYDEIDF